MSEFSMTGGVLGRSIHDAPERTAREVEDERLQEIMAGMSRTDLQKALVTMISAMRGAEGAAMRLERSLGPILNKQHLDDLISVTDHLIGDGLDNVDLILGDGALEALEASE